MTLERLPVDGDEQRRPYAATANVTAVLERSRKINLPERITPDFLAIVGIPGISRGRVMEALRFLRLIEESGRPSDLMKSYARAPDDEIRGLLASIVSDAYADDFTRVNPAEDAQPRIIAAFRRYQPRSQTQRMVMLFLGLCRAAGMQVLDAPRERQMQAQQTRSRSTARQATARAAAPSAMGAGPSTPAMPDQLGPIPSSPSPLLFGVTVDDIGALEPEQFTEVWSALGVIARARAMSLKAARSMAEQAATRREQEAQEDEPGQ
jgi:hypothetical protein